MKLTHNQMSTDRYSTRSGCSTSRSSSVLDNLDYSLLYILLISIIGYVGYEDVGLDNICYNDD